MSGRPKTSPRRSSSSSGGTAEKSSRTERIYVYSVDGADGRIAGLTALVSDGGDEAVVANLAGSIDPVLFGSVIGRLGEMDLDQFFSVDSDHD